MGSTRLLAAGTALVATLAGVTPARAAPAPVPKPAATTNAAPAPAEPRVAELQFNATPDEAATGAQVVLSGRAGYLGQDSGNAGRVQFWFRKHQKDPKIHLGSTPVSSSGQFRYLTRSTATGEYVAQYKHRTRDITIDATDWLGVYTSRSVDQMLYSWTGTRLSCLPSCRTVGPEQFISPGPVRVKLSRDCLQPRSGGRVGFTSDPGNTYRAGDPGWRDFPDGAGPTEFELTPGITKGHFYLEWTSGAAPEGGLTDCNLSLYASQTIPHKDYV